VHKLIKNKIIINKYMSEKGVPCTNLSFYDTTKYYPMTLTSAVVVHAISAARGFMSGFSGIFGGKLSAIEDKYVDIRNEALNEIREKAVKHGADMIAGVEFDISTVEQNFIVCLVSGTLLKKRDNKGGSACSSPKSHVSPTSNPKRTKRKSPSRKSATRTK
jgi:uncharacterized protein YbjQ (UPF0145 family)